MILLHYTNILYTETMKSRICTQIDWKIRQNQYLETIKRATLRATLSSIKQTNHLIMGKNSTSFYSISLVTNPFFTGFYTFTAFLPVLSHVWPTLHVLSSNYTPA